MSGSPVPVRSLHLKTLMHDRMQRSLIEWNRWEWSRTVARVKRRDRYTCQRCGSMLRLEVDHIIPRRVGGTDDLDNLRTLCHDCHLNRYEEAPQKSKPTSPLVSRSPFTRPRVM